MVISGTRPDTIKMAPVVLALRARSSGRTVFCVSGQHREMLDQALGAFGIRPDIDLNLMRRDQGLTGFMSRALPALRDAILSAKPDAVLVHGDTSTCLAGALAAFYERVPVGHIEAGLRTYDFEAPWPEEMHRRLVDPISRWCFVPTPHARANLIAERIPAERIHVTGNTAIDALILARARVRAHPPAIPGIEEGELADRRIVLVTGHRRESFGPPLRRICLALRDIAERVPDLLVVFPVHPNPNVQPHVFRTLADHPRIRLLQPLPYLPFVRLLDACEIVITDSGGIQEEAPSFGKPVLLTRDVTERPEGIAAGVTHLVGTTRDGLVGAAEALLAAPAGPHEDAIAPNPYGDGLAASRIVRLIENGWDHANAP